MSEKICEDCRGTGYYGDNGPGIRGNDEYQECECRKGVAVKHVREMNEQELRQRITALEREIAEAKARAEKSLNALSKRDEECFAISAERDRLRKALEEAGKQFAEIERMNHPMENGMTYEVARCAKLDALASAEKGEA